MKARWFKRLLPLFGCQDHPRDRIFLLRWSRVPPTPKKITRVILIPPFARQPPVKGFSIAEIASHTLLHPDLGPGKPFSAAHLRDGSRTTSCHGTGHRRPPHRDRTARISPGGSLEVCPTRKHDPFDIILLAHPVRVASNTHPRPRSTRERYNCSPGSTVSIARQGLLELETFEILHTSRHLSSHVVHAETHTSPPSIIGRGASVCRLRALIVELLAYRRGSTRHKC